MSIRTRKRRPRKRKTDFGHRACPSLESIPAIARTLLAGVPPAGCGDGLPENLKDG
jgi:hypothetical protein